MAAKCAWHVFKTNFTPSDVYEKTAGQRKEALPEFWEKKEDLLMNCQIISGAASSPIPGIRMRQPLLSFYFTEKR